MARSILFLLWWALAAQAQDAIPLAPGTPHERTLGGGETQSYRVTVAAGQFLRVIAEQRGIDVVVALYAPGGRKLAEVDSPTGDRGPESLSWIAEAAGDYRIEVRCDDRKARPGRYEARIEALRAPTDADRLRVAAERAAAEAESLFEGDAAARQRAFDKYGEALDAWRRLNDLPGMAAALTARGDLLTRLGRRQDALGSYQEALPVWRALKDKSHEALLLNNIAVISFERGDLRLALEIHNQALPLRRELRDRAGESRTLTGLGQALAQLGEKRKALAFFEQSLAISRDLKDAGEEARTLNSIGAAYSDLGDQQRALDAYSRALALRRDARGRAATLNNIGRAYDLLGAPEEALAQYEQALALARPSGDRQAEARALNFIGLARMSQGEFALARDAFAAALPLRRETNDRDGEASTRNNLGLAEEALGELRPAIEAYERAGAMFREIGNRQDEAHALNNLGCAYDKRGDARRAMKFHERSLALSRAAGDRLREAKVRYDIARIESRRDRLPQARSQLEETIRIVESLRAGLASPELRASYRATTQRYYDLYIDVLMRLGKRVPRSNLAAEALQAAERARARVLLELLAESGTEIREGADTSLLERERDLQERIADRTAAQIRALQRPAASVAARGLSLSLPAAADPAAAQEQELLALQGELRTVQADLRRTSPRYAALTQPPALSARDIQQTLVDSETTLLEYSLGEERGYLWIVTPSSIRGIALPGRETIERAARRFYESIATRSRIAPLESEASGAARAERLARADRESVLAGQALARMILPAMPRRPRLLIAADGALQYIPFAALPDPASGLPLVRRHEIVMLPSASALAALRRENAGRSAASKEIAILADPVFEPVDARVDAGARKTSPPNAAAPPELSRLLVVKSAKETRAADGIPRLPATRREAEAILALAPSASSRAVFDFAASRAFALQGELAAYRIIHFATHGFLNGSHPERSGLVLSLVNEQGAPQNGFLFAPDIYNLRLPAAELIVLSACQTGLGKEVRGEGIVGLTRGFMYAGAPRLVVSLWSVSDRATAELMKRFYEGLLGKGLRPAAALRAAQLEIAKQPAWRAPYYWAAFGLQGEWR